MAPNKLLQAILLLVGGISSPLHIRLSSPAIVIAIEPPAQPGLNEVLRLVARLGGFLDYKDDGEPGSETIWKGLTKVHIAAETRFVTR
jgi:hypothetical protein